MPRNLVQLVVTIITLTKGSVDLAKTSLIGTVISNLLLMVGTGIFIGGIDRFEQHFNQAALGSLLHELLFSVAVLIIVDAFQAFADGDQSTKSERILTFSRGTSVLLILSYICYALFSYKTHAMIFTTPHPNARKWRVEDTGVDKQCGIAKFGLRVAASISGTHVNKIEMTPLASLSRTVLVLAVIVDTALLGFSTTFVVGVPRSFHAYILCIQPCFHWFAS